jgi:Ni/Fe-hydrogenase subunit HybB-like protein
MNGASSSSATARTTAAATDATTASTDPRELSLRALGRPGPAWWVLAGFLASVVMVGVYAWIHQLRYGMGVSGYSDHAFWAVYIANVIAFIGVSYGGAVVSAILRLTGATWRAPLTRLAEATAVCTVLVGGAMIIPHLGRPDRIYELITHPNPTAPVFWDFIAVTTYTTASIIFFALPLIPDLAALRQHGEGRLSRMHERLYRFASRGWAGALRQRRVLSGALGLISILIIPLAVSVHSVLSWAFSTTSRPWWHESIWAPQFVVAALYSGVALVILVVAGFRKTYHLEGLITPRHFVRLGFIMAPLGAAYLYLTFADFLPGSYVGENSTATIFSELLVGKLAGWFWLFIIAGGVLPLVLIALPWTRNVAGMVVASAVIVPMMWIKRLLMVIAPANFDVVTGSTGSYHFTWVPIAITLAGVAAIPLLLMILFRFVPLLSIDEIEEIREQHEIDKVEAALEYLRQEAPETLAAHVADPVMATTALPDAPGDTHEPEPAAAPVGAVGPVGPDRSRRSRAIGVLLVLAALAGLATVLLHAAQPASAATPAKPSGPQVVMSGVETHGTVQLTVKVTDPNGAPAHTGTVTVALFSTTFGPHEVQLGTATPDKTGTVRLLLDGKHSNGYRPTRLGPQQFTASYVAKLGDAPVRFSTDVDITHANSAYLPPEPKPLHGAGHALIKALALIVATVWVLLLSQVFRVLRTCRRRPRPTTNLA